MGKHVAGANGTLPDGIAFERMTPEQVRAVAFFEGFEMPAEGVQPTGVDGACWLVWAADGHPRHAPGTILNVYVAEAYRRRGIATAMLAEARRIEPRVHHSEILTSDGRAWSEHVAGANGSLPEGLVIRRGDFALGDADPDCVRAFVDGEFVGALHWRVDYEGQGHVVSWISIYDDRWKRRGIATAMWEAAKQIVPDLHHAQNRTDEGQAWSQTTSGLNGGLPASLRLEVKPNRQGITAWMPGADVREVAEGPYGVPPEVLVGELNWGTDGMVTWVSVPYEELKRRGIATEMYRKAREVDPRVHHSTDRSESGDAWARSTGDEVPPLARPTGALDDVTLFHGTLAKHVPSIQAEGLHAPDGVNPLTWYMLTTSREQAASYTGGQPDAVVLEYRVPRAFTERGPERMLFGTPHDVYGVQATAYAIKGSLSSQYLVGVHPLPRTAAARWKPDVDPAKQVLSHQRTAMPSWRDRGEIPDADIVIKPDTGRSSRNYFEVILHGVTEARFTRLDQAKAFVEQIFGPLQWQRVPGDRTPRTDPTWGPTTEFNDAGYYLVVERAPRLAPSVAHTAQRLYHAAPKAARSSIERHGLDWRLSPAASAPRDPRNLAPVATYFYTDIDEARDMLADGMADTHDLYAVDGDGLTLVPDPYQPESAVYTLDVVPPERLHRMAVRTAAKGDGVDTCKFCGSANLWGNHFDTQGEGGSGEWDLLCQDCGKFQIRRNRRQAAVGQNDSNYIARGFVLTVENRSLFERFANGTVTVQDIIDAAHKDVGRVGRWWGIVGEFDSIDGFRSSWGQVFSEDDYVRYQHEHNEPGYTYWTGQVGVVLVAKRPTFQGKPWHPDDVDDDARGYPIHPAMGNSGLPASIDTVDLVEVHYDAGWGWKVLPAQGMRVKASVLTEERAWQMQREFTPGQRQTYTDEGAVRRLRQHRLYDSIEQFAAEATKVLRAEHYDKVDDLVVRLASASFASASFLVNEVGTSIVYPVIEVSMFMLDEMTMLHECAHLLTGPGRDRADNGHDERWKAVMDHLVRTYGSPGLQAAWTNPRTAAIDPARQGQCYPLAYEHLMANDDGTNRLVHGTLSGGRSHAWVEWTTAPKVVYDPVLDEEFERDFYYREAGARADAVYTADEAERKFAEEGHYGPWDGSVPRHAERGPSTAANRPPRRVSSKTAAGQVQHQDGTPLDYGGRFWGRAQRLYITEPGFSALGEMQARWPDEDEATLKGWIDKSNFKGSPDDLVAFLDYFETADTIYIGFMTTRDERKRRGLARALVDDLYRRYGATHTIRWGDIIDTGALVLFKRWKEKHDKTRGKVRIYGSRTAAWTPYPDPPGMTFREGGDAVPGGYNGWYALYDTVYTADEAERKFAEEGHYGPWDGSVPRVGSKIAALQWVKGTDKYDRPVYRAETEVGTYEVNGNGAGRMRWTVIYPAQYEGGDPDYGMTTSMAEAKAWAEGDYADRMRRRQGSTTASSGNGTWRGRWQMLGAKEAEADTEGVMIALVPPDEVNVGLCDLPETTEPLDNQHITVVYLGDTKDVDREALHQAVKAWASGSHPVDGKLSGFGTFDNGDEHVLYAAWQIEDGPGWRDSLKKALQAAGVDREDTYPMWTPHQTLAYTDKPVTDLPEMPDVPREVVFGSIVVAYGGDWTVYPLGR